jgi:membrane protein YdbS with pleckstrin-like domain
VAFFIRLRQRVLKIAMLLISAFLTLSLVLYYAQGRLGLPVFTILVLLVLGLFITPAVLEHRIKHNQT